MKAALAAVGQRCSVGSIDVSPAGANGTVKITISTGCKLKPAGLMRDTLRTRHFGELGSQAKCLIFKCPGAESNHRHRDFKSRCPPGSSHSASKSLPSYASARARIGQSGSTAKAELMKANPFCDGSRRSPSGLQLCCTLGSVTPPKKLQLSLFSVDFHRPVTPAL
jgi:hypothetical protein